MPVFLLIGTANFAAIALALVVVGVILGSSAGVYAAATCEVFPTNVRYSSLSLGYSVAVSIFGGTTPLIFTALLAATGSPISPAFYLIASTRGVMADLRAWCTAEIDAQTRRILPEVGFDLSAGDLRPVAYSPPSVLDVRSEGLWPSGGRLTTSQRLSPCGAVSLV